MRISDWSSDVCSSDLPDLPLAALVYVDDTGKGITRKKHRIGWAYFDARGRRIEDAEEIRRLNGIGLPPAYVNCWFCPDPNGHLQAIGYRSEEHTSELQSLMRISYAVFCLKKKKTQR